MILELKLWRFFYLGCNYLTWNFLDTVWFRLETCDKRMIRIINLLPPGMLWLSHAVICLQFFRSFDLNNVLLPVIINLFISIFKQVIIGLHHIFFV
jgi:hypothetical protein